MNIRLRSAAAVIAAIMTLLFALPAGAQNASAAITGSIVDRKSALPVTGASVVLSQGGKRVSATQTDSAGRFTFAQVTPGIYSVSITARGYTPALTSDVVVAAGTSTRLDSTLSIAASNGGTLRTIGRVSTSANSTLAQATTISQSIDIDEVLKTGQYRAYNQLETLPGVNASTSSSVGDDAGVNIRGFGSTETATLLDGHPVGPLGVQAPDSFNYADTPSFGLSGVTVTYGSGAQGLYGSDTIAGAIDFETISPTAKPELNFLQSIGGFGIRSTGLSATGTYAKSAMRWRPPCRASRARSTASKSFKAPGRVG